MEITRELILVAKQKDHPATTVLLASEYLKANRGDMEVLLDYAEMLYKMTRYEDAIQIYMDAISLLDEGSNGWSIFIQLGRMYQYWGRPNEAEPWFRKAIEAEPDELASYIFLGACLARQGKLKQAEEMHRMATIKCPGSWLTDEAYHNLGLVLRGQGKLPEAADIFRKAIAITPNYSDALEALEDVEMAMSFEERIGGVPTPSE
jgi:tetratricopeptide (TPR) repeat protein